MACNIDKVITGLKEEYKVTDGEALETAARIVGVLDRVGIEYGRDFIFKRVEGGKFLFRFTDENSLNLAIKTLWGE